MDSAESIIKSIKGMVTPIRHEGIPFIAGCVFVALFFGWFWQPLLWLGLIVAGWCTYFFRDPRRVTPLEPGLVVSPADGRVAAVSIGVAPKELGLGEQTRRRVSIAMSMFDCHVNRAPIGGRISRIVYTPGKLPSGEVDKASPNNERNAIVFDSAHGPVGVVQTAGLVARRIVSFVREGQSIGAGERFGLIWFGSRLDVYLPEGTKALVSEGQTAIAGETVLADFRLGDSGRTYRAD